MAWLAETTIYRLNRVPDKNYVEFLKLLGVERRPVLPARSIVAFDARLQGREQEPTDASRKEAEAVLRRIQAGTPVATKRTESSDAVVFETSRDLNLTTAQLMNCLSRSGGSAAECLWTDHHPALADRERTTAFRIFRGSESPDHILYLGDPRFGLLERDSQLAIYISHLLPEDASLLALDWEFWDGTEWQPTVPQEDTTESFRTKGYIRFARIAGAKPCTVGGIEDYWIRCRMVRVDSRLKLPELALPIAAVSMKEGEFVAPSAMLSNPANSPSFFPLDGTKAFHPFVRIGRKQEEPPYVGSGTPGDTFYLCCDRVLGQAGSMVRIHVLLHEDALVREAAGLRLAWEYPISDSKWTQLGETWPTRGQEGGGSSFADTTRALTSSGIVRFECPVDIVPVAPAEGERAYWIRARIVRGGYAEGPGSPKLQSVSLAFEEHRSRPFEHVMSCNHGRLEIIEQGSPDPSSPTPVFSPFRIDLEEPPALYLGFDRPFANRRQSLYFGIEEPSAREIEATAWSDRSLETSVLRLVQIKDAVPSDKLAIAWEYWDGVNRTWAELPIERDGTEGFTRAGCIEFIGPSSLGRREVEEHVAFWIRAKWIAGAKAAPPSVRTITPNAVEVVQATSVHDETPWPSTGLPAQRFELSRRPILVPVGGVLTGQSTEDEQLEPQVWIRERENASEQDIREYEEELDPERIEVDAKNAVWIRWHRVSHFLESDHRSRHYTLDPLDAVLTFGDGEYGAIPPKGTDNVACRHYCTGGGSAGNVDVGLISRILKPSPAASVTNIVPATGGADTETLEETKARAPAMIEHRFRAVTAGDFEHLARTASPEVARVRCLPPDNESGVVTVIVVPKGEAERPMPSTGLIRYVEDYLDRRRLVTTKIRVLGPAYRAVTVDAEVVLKPQALGAADEVARLSESAVRDFLHPLTGGAKKAGWEFGRSVHISELYYLLEKELDVDHVATLELNGDASVERVGLKQNELVHLARVNVRIVSERD